MFLLPTKISYLDLNSMELFLQTLYPVNHLRNLALSAVHTEYVFLTDGDFITHKDVYSSAKTLLAKMPSVEKKVCLSI